MASNASRVMRAIGPCAGQTGAISATSPPFDGNSCTGPTIHAGFPASAVKVVRLNAQFQGREASANLFTKNGHYCHRKRAGGDEGINGQFESAHLHSS